MDITATDSARARQEYRDPTRVLTGVLAPFEKRCLLWLAGRLPRAINPDHLTALALAAMVGAGASYWLARVTPIGLGLVAVSLAVNWFGDSLDGTLARVRRQQRPRYGFYVDHVVDAVGSAFLFGGMALSGYMSPVIALVLLAAYLLVCAEAYLATHCLGTFTMSMFKIGPTELRILLVAGNLAVFLHPMAEIAGRTFRLFDLAGGIAAAGLGITLVISAIKNARALYRAEPRPA
jgi:archaetidylinositol phosphate synthase